MNKDTVMTLKNLKKDILAIQVPEDIDRTTVIILRNRVISEIDKTIKRKS